MDNRKLLKQRLLERINKKSSTKGKALAPSVDYSSLFADLNFSNLIAPPPSPVTSHINPVREPNALCEFYPYSQLDFAISPNSMDFAISPNSQLDFAISPNSMDFAISPNSMDFAISPNSQLDFANSPNFKLDFANSPNFKLDLAIPKMDQMDFERALLKLDFISPNSQMDYSSFISSINPINLNPFDDLEALFRID
jgi:hypothetical protein